MEILKLLLTPITLPLKDLYNSLSTIPKDIVLLIAYFTPTVTLPTNCPALASWPPPRPCTPKHIDNTSALFYKVAIMHMAIVTAIIILSMCLNASWRATLKDLVQDPPEKQASKIRRLCRSNEVEFADSEALIKEDEEQSEMEDWEILVKESVEGKEGGYWAAVKKEIGEWAVTLGFGCP